MSDDAFVRDVKERTDLLALIGQHVRLKRSGTTWSGLCPFHTEKTPSFHVRPERGTYHCFGCEEGGDCYSFVMQMQGVTFPQALEELAQRLGMEVPRRGRPKGPDLTPLRAALQAAHALYLEQLRQAKGQPVRRAMEERLGAQGVAAYELGYAPAAGGLAEQLMERHGDALLKLGLVQEKERGGYRDLLWDRWIFPIRDVMGRLAGFSGRIVNERAKAPKYVNSPASPLFDKSRLVYNLHRARPEDGRLVVVEGYTDVIQLGQAGHGNAVAVMGTAFTDDHFRALFRKASEVVLCFDGDEAGRKATWRAIHTAAGHLGSERRLGVLHLSQGLDPDSLIRERGPEAMRGQLEASQPLSSFLVRHVAAADGLEERRTRLETAMDAVRQLPDMAMRQMWRDALASEAQVDPATLELGGPPGTEARGPASAHRGSPPDDDAPPLAEARPPQGWEEAPAQDWGETPLPGGRGGGAAPGGGERPERLALLEDLAEQMLDIALHHSEAALRVELTAEAESCAAGETADRAHAGTAGEARPGSPPSLAALMDLLGCLRRAEGGAVEAAEQWKLQRELNGEEAVRAHRYRGVPLAAEQAQEALRDLSFKLEMELGGSLGETPAQTLCRLIRARGAEAVPGSRRDKGRRMLDGARLRAGSPDRGALDEALQALARAK